MYSAGMLRERVTIHLPGETVQDEWGQHQAEGTTIERWAAVDFARGTRALREASVDAYDTIMVRLRDDEQIVRNCEIEWDGRMWTVTSFNRDQHQGNIQMTCTERDQSGRTSEEDE